MRKIGLIEEEIKEENQEVEEKTEKKQEVEEKTEKKPKK